MTTLTTAACFMALALSLLEMGYTKPTFELYEGNCNGTSNDSEHDPDLVFNQEIHLTSIPFISRKDEVRRFKTFISPIHLTTSRFSLVEEET